MAIITISRGTFSGGKQLAESVAEKLGYPCIARRVLVEAAKEYGVPLEKLSHALNDKPGILEGMALERIHYLTYIRAALSKDIKEEKLVYHGHAGHLLLKGVPHVLKVRVIADIESRIESAMKRQNVDRQQAITFINKVDSDRAKWTKFLYHVDLNDPTLYDLLINIENISVDSACEIVCMAANLPEFQVTPESQRRLADLILSTEVRAKIAADNSITDDGVEIDVNEGVVTISGTVHSLEDGDKVREIVRQQRGIKDIESHLRAPMQTRISW